MTQRLTAYESSSIISSNAQFCGVVGDTLLELRPKPEHEAMLLGCAARLIINGWISEDYSLGADPGGYVSEEEMIQIQTQLMFDECVAYGIIPGGLFGIAFWFIARQVAWLFLERLIENWWNADVSNGYVN